MSELRTNLLSNAAGTGPATLHKQSAAKAWANLNGTGTIALRASLNISSVADNGVGSYGFAMTTATSGASFSIESTCGAVTAGSTVSGARFDASQYMMFCYSGGNAAEDNGNVQSSIHGDLA